MLKKIIILSILLLPLSVKAIESTGWTQIKMIESRSVNVHDIYVEATIPSQNCQHNDRGLVDVSTDGGKAMMSVALAALMSGKQVEIKVNGCYSYAPRIITILIKP